MTEADRRQLRAAVRAGLFTRYHKPTEPERYGDRMLWRSVRHKAWARYA